MHHALQCLFVSTWGEGPAGEAPLASVHGVTTGTGVASEQRGLSSSSSGKGRERDSYPMEEPMEHIHRKHASTFAHLVNAWKLIAANSDGFCPWDRFACKSCVPQSSSVEAVRGVQSPGASSPRLLLGIGSVQGAQRAVPNGTAQYNT